VADGIPLQSTPDQVLTYLDSQKIEHSQYELDAFKGNYIKAALRSDPTQWDLVKTDYKIVFHFDSQNRFARSEIYEKYTGP
jgi:hypothetical protein